MDILDFFISSAYAQDAGSEPSIITSLLPLVVIFGIFYFLMIRPQMKRAKEHRALVEELKAGDEVVTNGGMLGLITMVSDSFVDIEMAKGVVIKVQRHAVANVLPKGTISGS
ncbi:MAG: preprotein translocase subunit YajC [Xanthomonadales bacterium]|nr:preprotein translocase subunit YajC [Xanthomonadales bacterium]